MNCFRSLYGLSLHEFLDSDTEPSMIRGINMDGSLLDTEPSMKRGINMDGSPCFP